MRQLNRSLVLDLVKRQAPISRAAIAKAASLAKPTVSVIVDELITAGLIDEMGVGATTIGGGRPPILLKFNARSAFVIGAHIGVGHVEILLADAKGGEIARFRRTTPAGRPPRVLASVAAMVRAAFKGSDASIDLLSAVGVTVPGLVDFDAGTCLLAPNLKWRNVAVGPLLSTALGVPVFVHNMSQACAVAESVLGVGVDVSDLVYLYLGTGIGVGILTDGELLHGSTGVAGEIGHCFVPGATKTCNCGKVGCLETIASGPSIAATVLELIDQGRPSSLAGRRDITAEDIALAAAGGDELSLEVFTAAGEAIGLALSWLVNLCNPQVVAVGGGVGKAGDVLFRPLRDAIVRHALPQAAAGVDVVHSTVEDAAARGAVLLALQHSERYYRVIVQG